MKPVIALLACAILTSCTDVPPEAVVSVTRVCNEQGMKVQVMDDRIVCFGRLKS